MRDTRPPPRIGSVPIIPEADNRAVRTDNMRDAAWTQGWNAALEAVAKEIDTQVTEVEQCAGMLAPAVTPVTQSWRMFADMLRGAAMRR